MTDIYTQENGSKKKFLAPVLVILLCMVSLTAAGYAYSATVVNTDDDVVIEGLTMELTDADGIVDDAMYHAKVAASTHTVNGKAIMYNETIANARGFANNDTYKAPANYGADLANFKPGYFIEVTADGTNSVYNADSVYTKETIAANITKLTKLTGDYNLAVNNQSGAAVDVVINVSATTPAIPAEFEGLKAILVLVYTGDLAGEWTPVQVATLDSGDVTIGSATNGVTTTYKIAAFAMTTNFYCAADDLADVVAAFSETPYEFIVKFTAGVANL